MPESAEEQVSFGTWLRRQREIREIPLREIADVTKISMRYLEALEQDRFDVLPAAVFAKGFLREYSRYVGLDPDDVVNSFLQAQEWVESDAEEIRSSSPRRSSRLRSGLPLALGLVAVLGVAAALILFGDRQQERVPVEAPPIAAPAPVVEAPVVAETQPDPEPAELAPLVVTLDFTEDCWVEASVDGEARISQLHVQGESITLEANERVLLTLGNPGGVRVEVNGEVYAPEFTEGRVARDLEIDLADLEPAPEPAPTDASAGAPADAAASDPTELP
jgi:cytoskeleton protein RodZ